jgi:hemoglobin
MNDDSGDDSNEESLYDQLGGAAGIRLLVESFYRHVDTLPEARDLRDMHPKDITSSIEKLYMFLSGWSGGPALYAQAHGHPKLRARHLPFKIGKEQRDLWLRCMLLAIEEQGIDDPLRKDLMETFLKVADHMRNDDRQS